jgi:DNA primase
MDTRLVLQKYGKIPTWYIGDSYNLLCPFHEDHNPSLNFNFVKRQDGVFYCHSCKAHGDIFELLAKYEQCGVVWSAVLIAELLKGEGSAATNEQSISRDDYDIQQIRKKAFNFYQNLPEVDCLGDAHCYLLERNFFESTLKTFFVRYNVNSIYKIIFPLLEQGVFRGYVMRRIDGKKERKYLNSTGYNRNEVLVGNLTPGPVLVTEGYLDMMMSYQHGMENVCCLLQWKISREQAKKLAKYATVIICGLDNDERGNQGYRELCVAMAPYGIPVLRMPFPEGIKDIGEMGRKTFLRSFCSISELTTAAA